MFLALKSEPCNKNKEYMYFPKIRTIFKIFAINGEKQTL